MLYLISQWKFQITKTQIVFQINYLTNFLEMGFVFIYRSTLHYFNKFFILHVLLFPARYHWAGCEWHQDCGTALRGWRSAQCLAPGRVSGLGTCDCCDQPEAQIKHMIGSCYSVDITSNVFTCRNQCWI